MSDIDDENNEDNYTELDNLQYNYDISKENFDDLLDDINDLWENVLLSYLEDSLNYNNGFLQNFKKQLLLGQKEFNNFMLETEIGKNIYDEYKLSHKNLYNYLKNHQEADIKDTLYYSDKIYDSLYSIREEHINLLQQDNPKKWLDIYTKELEPLYDYF